MRVLVLGLRGFPNIQGGVETHAEHLYPVLSGLGCDIEVVVRSPYMNRRSDENFPGILFRPIWAPTTNGAEAMVHSILGVLYAAWRRPDVLHIHAIGPAIVTPLAKLFRLKVVVTHHGPDYDREKWSKFAKFVLKAGESLGMRFADARIVISKVIADIVKDKYARDSDWIPNGVQIPKPVTQHDTLRDFGLDRGRYVLLVSRMVPEKRHTDLIEAFAKARLEGWKLVLVGDTKREDSYVRDVISAASETSNVVLTGFQTGQALEELYAHAGLFVLPSTHEGLPIALLEALSYGLPSIASNIPANLEVGLDPTQYFEVCNVDRLTECMRYNAELDRPADYPASLQAWVKEKYDWESIAKDTLSVYQRVSG